MREKSVEALFSFCGKIFKFASFSCFVRIEIKVRKDLAHTDISRPPYLSFLQDRTGGFEADDCLCVWK